MLVSVLGSGQSDTTERKRIETRLFFRHQTLRPRGLARACGVLICKFSNSLALAALR